MTKRKSKSAKTTVKAAVAKASVTKSSAAPATASSVAVIVLGFDDQQKPRGARFDAKPDLVTKAAELMGLKVYETSNPDVADIAKKLPVGRLYANGRGFVPNVRQDLYSDLVVALALEPQAARQRRQGRSASSAWPAPVLGRDRSWPSRHCPGVPRLRLVGGDRARPDRRHVHPAIPRLPAPSQAKLRPIDCRNSRQHLHEVDDRHKKGDCRNAASNGNQPIARSGAAGTCARVPGISGSTRLRPGATHLMSSKLPSKCSITAVQLSIQSPQLM